MSRSKRYMICGGVCLAMAGSIAILGIVGPLVVSLVLEVCAKRVQTRARSQYAERKAGSTEGQYLAHRQRRSVRKA